MRLRWSEMHLGIPIVYSNLKNVDCKRFHFSLDEYYRHSSGLGCLSRRAP